MRHPISYLVSTVLLFGVASQATTSGPQTVLYEVKLKSLSFGDMGTRKMYVKGENMRMQGKSGRLPMLVIKNSKGTFLIHPWYKIAARYPKDSERCNPRTYLPGPVESPRIFLARMKAVATGTEKIERQKCNIYSYREPADGRKCRLWVSTQTGKPVKLLIEGEKQKKATVVAMYTKFELGAKVPDSLFELPKGYAIRDMPARKLTSSDTTRSNPRGPI